MHIRHAWAAATVVVFLAANASARAASPEERRFVIIESPDNVLTKATRDHLRKAVGEVAIGQGLTLVPSETLPAKLLACEVPGCLPSVAAASGAIFVVRVEARFAKESFKLAVELWNSDAGKLLGRESKDCPICDEQDLWGSAALLAQGLLERGLQEPAKLVASPVLPAPPPEARVTAPPPRPLTSPAEPPSRLVEYSGLGLCLAGVAAISVGAYYVAVDGEPAGQDSDYDRDTRKLGLPMIIGGGVALTAGAGLLAWSFWPASTRVSLAPSGISVAGRF